MADPTTTSPSYSFNRTTTVVDAAGLLACLWWAAQYVALVLANKVVFSQPLFDYPWTIICIQSSITIITYLCLCALNRSDSPSSSPLSLLSRTNILNMLVPSLLFILYNYSNARALRFLSLPAFTVIKSLAPLGLTLTERLAFSSANHNTYFSTPIYLSLALSLLANVFIFDSASSITQTSLLGYLWTFFNVTTHIFYVLSLRYASGSFRTIDKAFVLNLMSIPFSLCFVVANREAATFVHEAALLPFSIRLPLIFSFALSAGCLVSVLSAFEAASTDALRYLAQTNKIAIVCFGSVLFQTKLTEHAWFGVVLALISGFLFVYARSKSAQKERESTGSFAGLPRPIVSSPTLELLLPTDSGEGAESVRSVGPFDSKGPAASDNGINIGEDDE